MKVRSLIITIVTGVIALLIVGANAYGWVAEHRSLLLLNRTITQPPATAIFVPKRAAAVISLLANIEDLENLHRLVTPANQRRLEYHAIANWKKQLADRIHLDYQREIAPWLGTEMTLAITDLDGVGVASAWRNRQAENPSESGYLTILTNRNRQEMPQPGYLAILTSRNSKVSTQTIQAWWDKQVADKRLNFETYQGVKIGYNRRDKLASAMVASKYILFANHPKVLREAINNLQATNLSILDNPTYQKLLAANNHHRIFVGYASSIELAPWLGKEAGEKYPQAGFNLGIDRQGAIADIVFYPTADRRTNSVSSVESIAALKYLPSQSTIAIAGIDLSDWHRQFTNIVPPQGQLLSLVDRSVGKISTQIGIDLTKDIFSWATGEYALAALPNPNHKATDWVFIAERTQAELADGAIAHFDELGRLAGYNVGLLPWQERSVIGWTKLATETNPTNVTQLVAQVPFTHTILDGYTLLASSVEAMDSTIKAIDKKSVLDTDRYHHAIDLISANQTGYLYGNWNTIQSLLPKSPQIRSIGEGIFSGLPNISLNSYTEAGTQRLTILLQVD
jgi:Protein of unknown function (DUF3352)